MVEVFVQKYHGPEKVGHLLLVAGISKVGKTTFVEHLQNGTIPGDPEDRKYLEPFRSPEIASPTSRNLLKRGRLLPAYDRLITQFDFSSIQRDSKVSPSDVTRRYRVTNIMRYYLHCQRMKILEAAETIDVVTLVAPLDEINKRCKPSHERKAVVRFYTCWLAYLCGFAGKIRKHWIVEAPAGNASAEDRYHFQPAWEYDFHQIFRS
jgi:hypothetical protein